MNMSYEKFMMYLRAIPEYITDDEDTDTNNSDSTTGVRTMNLMEFMNNA